MIMPGQPLCGAAIRQRARRAWFVAAAATGLVLPSLGGATALPVRASYLVLDDRVVDRVEHAHLTVGIVTKHPANPLFAEDRPWEVRFDNVYPNVLYDPEAGLYKCWYSPFIVDELTAGTPRVQRPGMKYHSTPTREMGLCYAVSRDGIHWEKPSLGVVEMSGRANNNLVLRYSHGAGVLEDRAEKDPARRFKLFGGQQIPGQKRRFQVAFSPDGIHWGPPLICPEIGVEGDTHNNAIWAPDLKRYVGITRRWEDGQRLVMRTESPDFTHWTPAIEVMRGDAGGQPYAMPIFSYADVYLGLVMMISLKTDRVQCELAWSADTVRWQRIDPGHALIPNSSTPGDYDWGCIYAGAVPVVGKDEIRLYYGASNGPHTSWRDGFFALATLRAERFAGYVAGDEPGVVVTQPVRLVGGQLLLNIDASSGDIGVEVLDEQGGTMPGLSGENAGIDDLRAPVRWKQAGGLAALRGRPVRFKFHLRNAKLFSFQIR
jgi:hypothetical protein